MHPSTPPPIRVVLSSVLASLLAPALACALAGCPEREVAAVDLQQSREQPEVFDVEINRDLDILFVIDNSASMGEEQDSLAANFDRFVEVLSSIEGGLPNVHIGVVSTDLGAGPYGIEGCTGSGDNGVLQSSARGSCSVPSESWIRDVLAEDGTRSRNYNGDLSEVFSCIARLGDTGCGFEQPLEAMRRALNGSNAVNQGFLRAQALLAVVIITDEDDCSTEDVRMFDSSAAQNTLDSELGFLSSHRCFEFGVQCEPDTPRALGPRQNCVPRTASPFMHDVGEYVSFLRSLKEDPRDVYVAGIFGDSSDVTVASKNGKPILEPACSSSAGEATPGVRLLSFLNAFPDRNTSTTICNEDLRAALTLIADDLGRVLGPPCLRGDLQLVDGEPVCTVADVLHYRQDGQQETLLPRCDSDHNNPPCFYFENDDACNDTGFKLLVERGDNAAPPNTQLLAHCAAN